MTDAYSVERAPRALAAVKKLLPQHVMDVLTAEPLGGCNAQCFRVDAGTESYFVRVLPKEGEWDELNMKTVSTCITNTRALGEACVTARVLASDESAVIQEFVPGQRMEYQNWMDLSEDEQCEEARRIGQMIAAVHAVPLPDPSAPFAPHCFYTWDIKAEKPADEQALLEIWQYIESQEAPSGVAGEIVLTHGDLHNKNVLEKVDGSLLVVDLELSGLGHRAFDLAFFFFHWEWFLAAGYPSLAARQAIARSYLEASKHPTSDASISELLWEVECVVLRVALLRASHDEIGEEKRVQYRVQLPLACELVKKARHGDQALRKAVVEQGLLPLSFEQLYNEKVIVVGAAACSPVASLPKKDTDEETRASGITSESDVSDDEASTVQRLVSEAISEPGRTLPFKLEVTVAGYVATVPCKGDM